MSDPVLASLTKHRAEMAVEAKATGATLRRILTDIDHLDGAIRTYDAAYKAPKINLSRAKRVAASRVALNILRQATVRMTLRQITLAIMAQTGKDQTNTKVVTQAMDPVRWALIRQRRSGVLWSTEGPGQSVLWEVAT